MPSIGSMVASKKGPDSRLKQTNNKKLSVKAAPNRNLMLYF